MSNPAREHSARPFPISIRSAASAPAAVLAKVDEERAEVAVALASADRSTAVWTADGSGTPLILGGQQGGITALAWLTLPVALAASSWATASLSRRASA